MARRFAVCPVCTKSNRRVRRMVPGDQLIVCDVCVRRRIAVVSTSDHHATSAGNGFEGVLTDALSHLAILLARLRGVPIAVGGDQIVLTLERMADTLAALTPRLPLEARTPLQCEIDRLGRIGAILLSPIDVVAELELLLQVGEFFNCFGVSLDRVLDDVESVALN